MAPPLPSLVSGASRLVAGKFRSPEVLARANRYGSYIRKQQVKRAAIGLASGAAVGGANFLLSWISGSSVDLRSSGADKNKLGIFGQAMGKGTTGVDTGAMPALIQPERVNNVNNPTIATIANQLDTLVKTANKIGLQSKQQQDAMLSQLAQARRVSKEQQLEQKSPVQPELSADTEATSNSLAPLEVSATVLAEKIKELSDTIDKKSTGGDAGGGSGGILSGILGGLGLAGLFGGKRAAAAAAVKLARPTVKLAGQTLVKNKAGAWNVVTKAGGWSFAPKALAAQAESKLARRAANPLLRAFSAAGSAAGRVSGAALSAGAISSKLAGLIGGGLKAAGRGAMSAAAVRAATRRAAAPVITRALGKTALKSIPIVGAGIGAAFAISRLLQGDVFGAGLDLASGLGGPLTAVPALAAIVARDTYSSVYGVQPEQDPEYATRMVAIKAAVEDMIKEQLSMSVQPKSPPTDQERGNIETPPVSAQRVNAPPPPVGSAPSPSGGGSTADGGSSSGGEFSSSATSSAAASGGASAAAIAQPSSATDGQQITSAEMATNATQMTGQYLNAQAVPVDTFWDQYGFTPEQGKFLPQRSSTTRGGAQGIGSIPDPVYRADNLEELKSTLFFAY